MAVKQHADETAASADSRSIHGCLRRDALKLLQADLSADDDYRARFEREADLASLPIFSADEMPVVLATGGGPAWTPRVISALSGNARGRLG